MQQSRAVTLGGEAPIASPKHEKSLGVFENFDFSQDMRRPTRL